MHVKPHHGSILTLSRGNGVSFVVVWYKLKALQSRKESESTIALPQQRDSKWRCLMGAKPRSITAAWKHCVSFSVNEVWKSAALIHLKSRLLKKPSRKPEWLKCNTSCRDWLYFGISPPIGTDADATVTLLLYLCFTKTTKRLVLCFHLVSWWALVLQHWRELEACCVQFYSSHFFMHFNNSTL